MRNPFKAAQPSNMSTTQERSSSPVGGTPTSSPEASPTRSPHPNEEPESDFEDDEEEIKNWDEGGPSDCGYHETVHDTLMTVGGSVHDIVGTPSESTKSTIHSIGNWFQELSYSVRDILRGKSDDIHQDAQDAVNEIMSVASKDGWSPEEKKESDLRIG